MEKFEEMALLLDIYGSLLTDRQRDVMDQYYNYDLSLQEIAENEGISKQGVHDMIRRSENILVKTEEKLGFMNRLSDIRAGLDRVTEKLNDMAQDIEAICKTQAANGLSNLNRTQASDSAEPDKTELKMAKLRETLEKCRTETENLKNTCMGGREIGI